MGDSGGGTRVHHPVFARMAADQAAALAELRRVIRPGGELRFYEHVQAGTAGLARFQRVIDVVWPYLGGGCHASRATLEAIEAAGFEVERVRRFRFRPSLATAPVAPHIVGAAQRPQARLDVYDVGVVG